MNGIVLHADTGGAMKGLTILAALERLGVLPQLIYPGGRNDSPFFEALSRTAKYRPDFPRDPFVDLPHASAWVAAFVSRYKH